VKSNYDDPNDRLAYIDIGDISRFIVEKKKSGQTENFEQFFENVEDIMMHGEHYVQELIVIGLFEDIQNIGGSEIDNYHSLDKWLKHNSLKAWRELIDSWEGTDQSLRFLSRPLATTFTPSKTSIANSFVCPKAVSEIFATAGLTFQIYKKQMYKQSTDFIGESKSAFYNVVIMNCGSEG